MRHRKRGRHLKRTSAHRKAMRRNLVSNLFLVERIRTTPAKAKECRSFAEKLITIAKAGDLTCFRRILAELDDKFIARKLVKDIAPRYKDRPGGYVRILHLSASENRVGDNAPQVIMELLPQDTKAATEGQPAAPAAAPAAKT
jgi:large subunit ribosomal protein L17